MKYLYLILFTTYRICNNCKKSVDETYTFCTNCGEGLSSKCLNCNKEIDTSMNYCGWCGTPLKSNTVPKDNDLKNVVKYVKERDSNSEQNERFNRSLKAHAEIRSNSLRNTTGKQRQIKDNKVIYYKKNHDLKIIFNLDFNNR